MNPIPQGWPGPDVNVEVWSVEDLVRSENNGRRETFWRARVTHRATGAAALTRSRNGRQALAEALATARKRADAYEVLGLGDLADQRERIEADLRRAA